MEDKHSSKMDKLQGEMKAKIRAADKDKGLILTLTGDGKGKSSSGFGMVSRALGHKMNVGVVQFIKGAWKTGEAEFCKAQPSVEYFAVGAGFTWDTKDKEADTALVEKTWNKARDFLADENVQLVLLDEINVAMHFGYLDVDKVVAMLKAKPEMQHVILTGRDAPEQILNISDTVTVMNSPTHAFEKGVRAQKGIEF